MILDATTLLLLLNDKTPAPKNPETGEPIPDAHERVKALVENITAAGQKVIIAAPVLAELMVRAENAASKYIEEFRNSSRFKMAAFDQKAAIEHALYTRQAIDAGDKRGGVNDDWAKVKFDRQIVAIVRASGINKICTDDGNLEKHAKKQNIEVFHVCDIQFMKQEELPLTPPEPEAKGESGEPGIAEPATSGEATPIADIPAPQVEQKPEAPKSDPKDEKGGAVVETAPPSV